MVNRLNKTEAMNKLAENLIRNPNYLREGRLRRPEGPYKCGVCGHGEPLDEPEPCPECGSTLAVKVGVDYPGACPTCGVPPQDDEPSVCPQCHLELANQARGQRGLRGGSEPSIEDMVDSLGERFRIRRGEVVFDGFSLPEGYTSYVEEHPEGADRGGYIPYVEDANGNRAYFDHTQCKWFVDDSDGVDDDS